MDAARDLLSPSYKPAVLFALGVQAFVGLLALLSLDGGRVAHVVGVAMLGFWLATAFLVARRPHAPSRLDLTWVRWGFWPTSSPLRSWAFADKADAANFNLS